MNKGMILSTPLRRKIIAEIGDKELRLSEITALIGKGETAYRTIKQMVDGNLLTRRLKPILIIQPNRKVKIKRNVYFYKVKKNAGDNR